jgi:hypothetical protein
VTAVALWCGSLNSLQWKLVAAVTVWIGATALSMTLNGDLRDNRFWSVAAISGGVTIAGALAGRELMTRGLFGLGWFYGWGSVAVGLSDWLIGWPTVLINDSDRYGRWLSMVGLNVGDVPSLNGVTPGRVYVGLNCAILLVFAARTLHQRRAGWQSWVMPAGLVVAILWSFSRTGIVASVIGLAAALFPYERFKSRRTVAWTVGAVGVVMLLPLTLSSLLLRAPISDGTTRWRFNLWQEYLTTPEIWTPFGRGPRAASPGWADHAHQQILEALAGGGWLGLGGFLAFVVIACMIAISASEWDGRATIAVVFAAAAIFQVDVLTYSANYWTVNNALVLLLTILVAAIGVPRKSGPPRAVDSHQIAATP